MKKITSYKPYQIPEHGKIKYYQDKVKNRDRKLVEASFFPHGGERFFIYRPCHQTNFGMKRNMWRVVAGAYPVQMMRRGLITVTIEDYNRLEKNIACKVWGLSDVDWPSVNQKIQNVRKKKTN